MKSKPKIILTNGTRIVVIRSNRGDINPSMKGTVIGFFEDGYAIQFEKKEGTHWMEMDFVQPLVNENQTPQATK